MIKNKTTCNRHNPFLIWNKDCTILMILLEDVIDVKTLVKNNEYMLCQITDALNRYCKNVFVNVCLLRSKSSHF